MVQAVTLVHAKINSESTITTFNQGTLSPVLTSPLLSEALQLTISPRAMLQTHFRSQTIEHVHRKVNEGISQALSPLTLGPKGELPVLQLPKVVQLDLDRGFIMVNKDGTQSPLRRMRMEANPILESTPLPTKSCKPRLSTFSIGGFDDPSILHQNLPAICKEHQLFSSGSGNPFTSPTVWDSHSVTQTQEPHQSAPAQASKMRGQDWWSNIVAEAQRQRQEGLLTAQRNQAGGGNGGGRGNDNSDGGDGLR
ncbi:hypothetical protein EWM64_g4151 [Hericium alpestre]|uniref:Uncharacterized protein n=1 Tax=Hericium alpestre TaxID=135208 RepID=A0A4Y9ZY94_9AGAM|nr:hypothetical protein EWM64_g4151 [Hericium alpestre]